MTAYNSLEDVRGAESIDSRDLIELREAIATMLSAEDDALDSDERSELEVGAAAIDALEAGGLEDWPYGAQLIREDRFEDYARELAEDVGALQNIEGQSWPMSHIDWASAAAELAMDYTLVRFLGWDYYVR